MSSILWEKKESFSTIYTKSSKANYMKKERKWLISFKRPTTLMKIGIRPITRFNLWNSMQKKRPLNLKNKSKRWAIWWKRSSFLPMSRKVFVITPTILQEIIFTTQINQFLMKQLKLSTIFIYFRRQTKKSS